MTDPIQQAAAGLTATETQAKGWLTRNRDWLWAVVIAGVAGLFVGFARGKGFI